MKKHQIIILVIAAVMLGGFVFGAYIPLSVKKKSLKSKRQAAGLVIKKLLDEARQVPELKLQAEMLQKDEKNYRSGIPGQMDLGPFLSTIASLMNENNLKDQSVKPGSDMLIGKLGCIPVDIKCSGRLVNIFEFFKSLQNLDRAVRVVLVNIVNDNSLTGELTMETRAVIYYKAQKMKG